MEGNDIEELGWKPMAIDQELQKYYEDRFSMMATQGWKDLCDDMEEMLKVTSNIDNISDEKTLQFRKGELSIIKWVLSLKKMSEQAYEGLNEGS